MQLKNMLCHTMVDYLKTSLGETTFEHSNTWTSTTDLLIHYACEDDEFDDMRDDKYISTYKRLSHILRPFVKNLDKNIPISDSEVYKSEKIYSEFVPDIQLELYNEMAEIIGFNPISRMFSDSVLLATAKMDNPSDKIDIKDIQKEFPFAFQDKSKGACFFENVFISIVYHTIYSQAINAFLRPLTDKTSITWTQKWVKNVNELCQEPKFLSLLTNEVLDRMYEVVAIEKNENFENLMRNYYLSKKYRKRKDFERLMNNTNARPSPQELQENLKEKGDIFNFLVKCEWNKENEYILNTIFTLADSMLNGEIPMVVDATNDNLSEYQYYSIVIEKTSNFLSSLNRIIQEYKAIGVNITIEDYLAAYIVSNICIKYVSLNVMKARELLAHLVNETTLRAMYENSISQTTTI